MNCVNHYEQSLKQCYEECSHEYQKALLNLEKFISKAKDLMLEIYDKTNPDNNSPERYTTSFNTLQEYRNILQNINRELHRNVSPTINNNNSIVTTNHIEHRILHLSEDVNEPPEVIVPKEKSSLLLSPKEKQNAVIEKEHPMKHFKFPQPELHLYSKDYDGVCLISYVQKIGKHFFLLDHSMVTCTYRESLIKLSKLSFTLKCHTNWIPSVDEVFGILLDGYMFRAVKQTKAEPTDREFKIFLIDTGEILDITLDSVKLYSLKSEISKMPSQVLFCVLDKKCTETLENLRANMYEERAFKIVKIRKSTLSVEIRTITNPFYSEIVTKKLSESKLLENSTLNNTQGYAPEYTSSSDDFINSTNASDASDGNHKQTNHFSTESEKLVFKETKSTSNAIEAVMGFQPTDDKRLCQFYDPKIKGCFKGANCKLLHLPKLEGGWSRDKEEIKFSILLDIEYPEVKSTIKLIPTHVDDVERFYGQIVTDQSRNINELKGLNCRLNSPEYVLRYKKFEHRTPVELELVLAKYRTDSLWYRARVVGFMYDSNTVKVFYLDYGNCDIVSVDNVRQWDTRFDYLPFQAILCRIANVGCLENRSFEGTCELSKMIVNKIHSALVINNLSEINVILIDKDGFDIGEQLVTRNLAKLKNVGELVPEKTCKVPI